MTFLFCFPAISGQICWSYLKFQSVTEVPTMDGAAHSQLDVDTNLLSPRVIIVADTLIYVLENTLLSLFWEF